MPFVSGINFQANKSCKIIIQQKKPKIKPPPICVAKNGKTCATIAAHVQCVKQPKEVPAARTEFGNISEIKTQIIAP